MRTSVFLVGEGYIGPWTSMMLSLTGHGRVSTFDDAFLVFECKQQDIPHGPWTGTFQVESQSKCPRVGADSVVPACLLREVVYSGCGALPFPIRRTLVFLVGSGQITVTWPGDCDDFRAWVLQYMSNGGHFGVLAFDDDIFYRTWARSHFHRGILFVLFKCRQQDSTHGPAAIPGLVHSRTWRRVVTLDKVGSADFST